MGPESDRLSGRATLACVLMTLALQAVPHAAHAQARSPGPIGPRTVGSKLSEVRAYPQEGDCVIEANGADCTFLSPEGVEYVVLGTSVTQVIAKEKTIHAAVTLPFGLKFGDSLPTTLPKLVAQGRKWTLRPPEDGPKDQIFLSSEDTYPGLNGSSFDVELYFDHDRLVRIDYNSDEGD
jgi:hypothetical protein